MDNSYYWISYTLLDSVLIRGDKEQTKESPFLLEASVIVWCVRGVASDIKTNKYIIRPLETCAICAEIKTRILMLSNVN